MSRNYKTQGVCKKCKKGFIVEDKKYISYMSKNYCEACNKLFVPVSH